MSYVKKSNAQYFLFMNAFLWGSSYVWSKMLLGYLPRFSILFLTAMGGLAATTVMFLPYIKSISAGTIIRSVVISCFSILSNTFFMLALQYTSSSNTAFIVQMSVIITPIIMAVFHKKLPEGKILISAVIALTGLFLITCDPTNFKLNLGDLLALGNALFFSLFLTGMKICSEKVDPIQFTFVHHTTNTVGFLILAGIFEAQLIDVQKLKSPMFAALIAASILIVVVTNLLQSTAIKFVKAEKATLIYTFEPVTTLLLGFAFIGERLEGMRAIAGCLLILGAVVYSVCRPRKKRRRHGGEATPEIGLEIGKRSVA